MFIYLVNVINEFNHTDNITSAIKSIEKFSLEIFSIVNCPKHEIDVSIKYETNYCSVRSLLISTLFQIFTNCEKIELLKPSTLKIYLCC